MASPKLSKTKQKPHTWKSGSDVRCCIACEKPFAVGDKVYTHGAVNLHERCKERYRKQLIRLGLTP